jgi:serine/threonine protein kinase
LCLVCGGHFVATSRCPKDGTSLVPINHDVEIGDSLGKDYEVLDTIGRGGMSIVYKAKHKVMKRVVALKVLTASDLYSVKRFQLEAQLASNLQHENIVTVFEFGQDDDGRPYIAMAYVEGKTLSAVISEEGPILYRRALPLFIQACDALAYAHTSGVIHRDLKPSNFMLVRTKKGDEQIKLLDFGIAKQLEPTDDLQQLTASGQVFGSPLYMSPEQCLGHKLDARADIYSIGCVMYEVLSGQPPFVGKSPLDTMQMHVQQDAKPFRQINNDVDVPRQFEHIVLRALERDLSKRYKSVDELYNDLNFFRIQLKAMENSMGLTTSELPMSMGAGAHPSPGSDDAGAGGSGLNPFAQPADRSGASQAFSAAASDSAQSSALGQSGQQTSHAAQSTGDSQAQPKARPQTPTAGASGRMTGRNSLSDVFDASPNAGADALGATSNSGSFAQRFSDKEIPSAAAAMRQMLGETEPPGNLSPVEDVPRLFSEEAPHSISSSSSLSSGSVDTDRGKLFQTDVPASKAAGQNIFGRKTDGQPGQPGQQGQAQNAWQSMPSGENNPSKPESQGKQGARIMDIPVAAIILAILALLIAVFGVIMLRQ